MTSPGVSVAALAPSSLASAVAAGLARGGGAGSRVLTASAVGTLLDALEGGETRAVACRRAGVSGSVLAGALRGSSALRDAVDAAEEGVWSEAETGLLAAVRQGEPWAIREALKHRSLRERWSLAEGSGTGVGSGAVGSAADVLALGAELERRRVALFGSGGVAEVLDVSGR